ncbi:insulinase family protein [Marivibrio halodurans]|uniref:Insulinase family protein n=1 Tax=Marivibrio halodurans TaxID=2039722 RepID=A0A8J7V564_9PROT|nr:pitrilysin family protein [Marivibrio halodurans]MBP5858514.1 insulinase family protein [Marivibrio halodurans]
MSVRVTRLSNGLTVATDRMDHVATASLGIWVGAGTRAEPAEINGVAHFLEHMAFKGTERRSARMIAEEIEAVGGILNAYTARENTAYYVKVLAEDVPLALDIVSDILMNPTFDPVELDRERSVILQEIGQAHDTPDDIIFDHFQEHAYRDQAMGRPTLGTVETVRAMPREAIRDFMGRRYAGDRMVLAAAGNVDHDRIVALAEAAFGALRPRADVSIEAARYTGGEIRETRESEQVHLILGFQGSSYTDRDFYPAAVLNTALGGGMSSRLFQQIREERGLVYSIFSFNASFADDGIFGVYAGTGPEDVGELVPVLCDEIAGVAARPMPAEEIARARAQVKAAMLMARESTGARCDQLGQQILIHGQPIPIEEQVAKLEAVDAEAVARAAGRIFGTAPTLAATGPLGRLESFDRIAGRLPARAA